MKTLRLLDAEIRDQSTLDVVAACLDKPPAGGFILAELRARGRVADAVDRARQCMDEQLVLEDADAAVLQKCVADMRWAVRDASIVVFADAVAGMPDAVAGALPEAPLTPQERLDRAVAEGDGYAAREAGAALARGNGAA